MTITTYVVVDCEAGMEYLSRLTVDDVDTLVLTAEQTAVGLTTIRRIAELSYQLPIRVGRRVLALNKLALPGESAAVPGLPSDLPAVQAVVQVPFDSDLARRSADGDPIDDHAGPGSRAAIARLARDCLSLSS